MLPQSAVTAVQWDSKPQSAVQGDSKTKSVNDKLKKHDIGGHVIEARKPIPFGFAKKGF